VSVFVVEVSYQNSCMLLCSEGVEGVLAFWVGGNGLHVKPLALAVCLVYLADIEILLSS